LSAEVWGLRVEGWGSRVDLGLRVEGWRLRVEVWGLRVSPVGHGNTEGRRFALDHLHELGVHAGTGLFFGRRGQGWGTRLSVSKISRWKWGTRTRIWLDLIDSQTFVAKFWIFPLRICHPPTIKMSVYLAVRFRVGWESFIWLGSPGSNLLHHEGLDLVVEELSLKVGLVSLIELLEDHSLGNGHA